MIDRDYLIWLHERMEHVYKEDRCLDFMRKLRCIISEYPAGKNTPNDTRGLDSMEMLKDLLEDE